MSDIQQPMQCLPVKRPDFGIQQCLLQENLNQPFLLRPCLDNREPVFAEKSGMIAIIRRAYAISPGPSNSAIAYTSGMSVCPWAV